MTRKTGRTRWDAQEASTSPEAGSDDTFQLEWVWWGWGRRTDDEGSVLGRGRGHGVLRWAGHSVRHAGGNELFFLRIWKDHYESRNQILSPAVTESHLIFLQITFQIYESGVWNRMKLVSPPRCRTSIRPHSFPCFTSTSSLIRPLSPSSSSISSQSLTNNPNFTLHPNFYTPSECRQLLSAALWKLDRVDSSRRRSRSPQSSPLASESDDSLQDLFQGPYGFEEVPLPFSYWLYHVLIDARATSIR